MSISSDRVKSPEEALAYIVDCTLATVSSLAMKKSRPAGEYKRQIAIAQHGVDWLRAFHIPSDGTRAEHVATSVADWAKRYEAKEEA
jgi:hypothetical protein